MERLIQTIGESLAPLGFQAHRRPQMADMGVVAFWRRCTGNTNRAVAVLRRPTGDFDLRPYCRRIKWSLLRQTRFIPFLYELGLQIVIVGDGLEYVVEDSVNLRQALDKVSNQFVVLQSIFIVDESTNQYNFAKTWGQVVTGQFQEAVARGIEAAGIKAFESG